MGKATLLHTAMLEWSPYLLYTDGWRYGAVRGKQLDTSAGTTLTSAGPSQATVRLGLVVKVITAWWRHAQLLPTSSGPRLRTEILVTIRQEWTDDVQVGSCKQSRALFNVFKIWKVCFGCLRHLETQSSSCIPLGSKYLK